MPNLTFSYDPSHDVFYYKKENPIDLFAFMTRFTEKAVVVHMHTRTTPCSGTCKAVEVKTGRNCALFNGAVHLFQHDREPW